MSDDEVNQKENLEFFDAAIFQPALQRFLLPTDSVTGAFNLVESLVWAGFGSAIGYFVPERAYELIWSAPLDEALELLIGSGRVGREESWSQDIIQMAERGASRPQYLSELENVTPDQQDFLREAFQNCLLLTAENVVADPLSELFLDAVGWSSDEQWRDKLEKKLHREKSITVGFANVLHYLEAMMSYSLFFEDESSRRFDSTSGRNLVYSFPEKVRALIGRKLNLTQSNIVDRYFWFAGQLVNHVWNEGAQSWADPRLNAFYQLSIMLAYWGGPGVISEDRVKMFFPAGALREPFEGFEARSSERRTEENEGA